MDKYHQDAVASLHRRRVANTMRSPITPDTTLLRKFSKLDAFPKVEAGYREGSTTGGIATVFVCVVLFVLLLSEFENWRNVKQTYQVSVDNMASWTRSGLSMNKESGSKISINVDMTIATPFLRIDVLDASGAKTHISTNLITTHTIFEAKNAKKLSELDDLQDGKKIKDIVRDSGRQGDSSTDPKIKGEDADACHIRGTVQVNKISGNLHITALGHGYGSIHIPHDFINFTHRVDRFSFGMNYPGLVNPLDNSIENAEKPMQDFYYFISVVPTIYIDRYGRILFTNQYSVTDHTRMFDNNHPGIPGIFFSYAFEPIMVTITESSTRLVYFFIRVCGIVGGIYVSVGMIYQIATMIYFKDYKAVPSSPSID